MLALGLWGCGEAAPDSASDAAPDAAARDDASAPDAGDWREAARVDGRFSRNEWVAIGRLSPPPPRLASPTNRWADHPGAAAWGRALFDDTQLSGDGTVACAGCHAPTTAFIDGRGIAVAQRARVLGSRNTPSIVWSAQHRWQGWAGHADSIWAQSLAAIENPREHNLSPLALVHTVARAHRAAYEPVFGALPDLSDARRFPAEGGPGTPAWEAMSPADRDIVLRIESNVGKAIEAHLRTLTPRRLAPFDRFVAGEREAMSPEARDGLALFLRVGCIHCHNGPMLSDFDFHAIRMPDDPGVGPDRGRATALAELAANPFVGWGRYSDDPASARPAEPLSVSAEGQFVTPTLRGVAETAPYGHAGTLATLEAVIRHDAMGGLPPGDPGAVGRVNPNLLAPFQPTDAEVAALVAFLRALSSPE